MTLQEISREYRHSAALLRHRLQQLRAQLTRTTDSEQIWQLQRRIAVLAPMLTEMNELAQLTEHYYDRGFYRNEKYTFQYSPGSSFDAGAAATTDPQCD